MSNYTDEQVLEAVARYLSDSVYQHVADDLKSLVRADEDAYMRALAERISNNAHPEEDGRLEVAYAIARHLGLGWTAALSTQPAPSAPVTREEAETFLGRYHDEVWAAAEADDPTVAYDDAGRTLAKEFLARFNGSAHGAAQGAVR